MTTILIENADKKNASLIVELAKALGLSVKTSTSKKWVATPGVITNPALLKRIEKAEKNKKNRKRFTEAGLKAKLDKMVADNV